MHRRAGDVARACRVNPGVCRGLLGDLGEQKLLERLLPRVAPSRQRDPRQLRHRHASTRAPTASSQSLHRHQRERRDGGAAAARSSTPRPSRTPRRPTRELTDEAPRVLRTPTSRPSTAFSSAQAAGKPVRAKDQAVKADLGQVGRRRATPHARRLRRQRQLSDSRGVAELSLSRPNGATVDATKFDGEMATKEILLDASVKPPEGPAATQEAQGDRCSGRG